MDELKLSFKEIPEEHHLEGEFIVYAVRPLSVSRVSGHTLCMVEMRSTWGQ